MQTKHVNNREDMLHSWEWGRVLLEVVFSKWEKIGLFPSQANDKIPESINGQLVSQSI